jgi:hypothetical protein
VPTTEVITLSLSPSLSLPLSLAFHPQIQIHMQMLAQEAYARYKWTQAKQAAQLEDAASSGGFRALQIVRFWRGGGGCVGVLGYGWLWVDMGVQLGVGGWEGGMCELY